MPLPYVTDWSLSVKDIIQWVVWILVAVGIYFSFQRHQVRIARHSIVRQIEEDVSALFCSEVARVEVISSGSAGVEKREFRAVLDDKPNWTFDEGRSASLVSGLPQAKFRFIDGQRFWQIRSSTEADGTVICQFLSSKAFQETLIWFRRVNRALQDKVIKNKELLDLWHTILPLGYAGRANYFAKYFQGAEDIDAMVQVINATLRAADKAKIYGPLYRFGSLATEQDWAVLEGRGRGKLRAKINRAQKKMKLSFRATTNEIGLQPMPKTSPPNNSYRTFDKRQTGP